MRSLPLNAKMTRFAMAVVVVLLISSYVGWCTAHRVHRGNIDARMTSLQELIDEQAQRTGLSAKLITDVVRAESGGDPRAVSRVGAKGLMQLLPAAEDDALKQLNLPADFKGDLFDPKYNLLIGTTYLKHMVERFDGDEYLAVAAYHMGPTRIKKLQREHPHMSGREIIAKLAGPQTKAYVKKVFEQK